MSKRNARHYVETQKIEANSSIFIDSVAFSKKDALHILHVDDDTCVLQVSKQILLMDNNFEIDSVISVYEAFKKMEKQTFDAIVSDYEMPIKKGLDFLKELREKKNDIPFILFSGKGREYVVVKQKNF